MIRYRHKINTSRQFTADFFKVDCGKDMERNVMVDASREPSHPFEDYACGTFKDYACGILDQRIGCLGAASRNAYGTASNQGSSTNNPLSSHALPVAS
jgi:hypothetical protein